MLLKLCEEAIEILNIESVWGEQGRSRGWAWHGRCEQ